MLRLVTISTFLALLAACASSDEENEVVVEQLPRVPKILSPAVLRLARCIEGFRTNARHAEASADPTLRSIACARIWPDRSGLWLYVEGVRLGAPRAPDRQEIWHVVDRRDGSLSVSLYDLPAPASDFAGAWRDDQPLAPLGPKDVLERTGCVMTLLEREGSFQGGTNGSHCIDGAGQRHDRRIVAQLDRLIVWERSYDSFGRQIPGSSSGPVTYTVP